MSIEDKAKEALGWLVSDKAREGKTFLRDGAPERVIDLVREAHGDFLPDDYRYEYIKESLELIAQDVEDAEESLEADTYNADLLKWVSSNLNRMAYVDQALEECKCAFLGEYLAIGQLTERQEVFTLVLSSLEEGES